MAIYSVGRKRVILALLLTTALLLTLDLRGNPVIDGLRNGFSYAMDPVESATDVVTVPIERVWHGIMDYDNLERENLALQEKIDRLIGTQAAAEAAVIEGKELQALYSLPSLSGIDTEVARVVGYAANNLDQVIEIDKGSLSGIEVGMPVVNQAGLVGKVTQVSANSARVMLVTDAEGVVSTTYQSGGVTFRREAFASHPDQVMVLTFSADRPGACTGTVRLKGAHKEATAAAGNSLTFTGALVNGLKYEAKLVALNNGGTLQAGDGKLEFKSCHRLTLLVAAGTDYARDYARHYRGEHPHAAIEKRLAAAGAKKYEELKAAHIAEYQSWFNRMVLDVGTTPADRLTLPIDRRKVLHAEKGGDPELEALLFQYGRYLLISCSRPGGLPANLQGLWNDSNDPPWHSDYHANINVQMNYWPAEPANLAECHTPLFDLIVSQLEPWRKATAAEQRFATASGRSGGWAVRTSHGINGDEGWQWDVPANAWYCQHFWMHYAFGGDKEWLRKVAYPVIKETCEFWEARLKTLPDGKSRNDGWPDRDSGSGPRPAEEPR